MLVEHIAVGFAAKRAAPLGSLVLAAVLLDALVWTDVVVWAFVVAGLDIAVTATLPAVTVVGRSSGRHYD